MVSWMYSFKLLHERFFSREIETGGVRGLESWADGDEYVRFDLLHWNRTAYDVIFKCLTSNACNILDTTVLFNIYFIECLGDFKNVDTTVPGQEIGLEHSPGTVALHNCPENRTGYSMYFQS